LPVAGAELVGPPHAELQTYVEFTAGIGASSEETAVARTFIECLKAPSAIPAFKAKGMEPG